MASVMCILLICAWIFVFVSHVRAFLRKDIMMPGKDEDKGEPPTSGMSCHRYNADECADQYKEDDANHNIATPP